MVRCGSRRLRWHMPHRGTTSGGRMKVETETMEPRASERSMSSASRAIWMVSSLAGGVRGSAVSAGVCPLSYWIGFGQSVFRCDG